MEEDPLWNTKQKLLKKGPKWYGPYEVAERKDGGNGNYLLMALSGKNKGLLAFAIQKDFPNILNCFRIFVDVFDEMLVQEKGIMLHEMPHDVKL